jgi:uncharacterized protein (TIGR01777 family)
MKILIAGASGMVGQELVKSLAGHEIILLGRLEKKLKKQFPEHRTITWHTLHDFHEPVDIIIHLSGENIGKGLWTAKFKQKIMHSRVDSAQALIDWVKQHQYKPRVLAANAIGFYGCYPDHHSPVFTEEVFLDENTPNSFLQKTSFVWQAVWHDLPLDTPLTIMRFGVILNAHQGMLKKLEPSFKIGLGAVIGSGQQYISWITLEDLVGAINFLIQHKSIQGPINLVSPSPVNQFIFGKTLAKVFKRPFFLKLPTKLVKVLFGQMGEELLLSGQYVIPKRLNDAGFVFKYPQLEEALTKLYRK